MALSLFFNGRIKQNHEWYNGIVEHNEDNLIAKMNLTAPPPMINFETKKKKWSKEYRVKSPSITLGSMGLGDAYDEL